MLRKEAFFASRDGTELFYQTWSPRAGQSPEAVFVVTHGLAEHSEAYDSFAQSMVQRGFKVIAWDLRGHGRSPGKRGYIDNFHHFSLDLADFIEYLQASSSLDLPFFCLGHSLGGLVSIRSAVDGALVDANALCLSAPLLGVSLQVPKVKDFAARILNRLWPSITLGNEIAYEDLTHDQKKIASYKADPFRHDKISPPLYLGIWENIAYVLSQTNKISSPVFLQTAKLDKIVSVEAQNTWFAQIASTDKNQIVYEKSFHEIYNDLEREKAFDDLAFFAKAHLANSRPGRKK